MGLLRHIAEVINGLQAPYSLESTNLGTAGPAWIKVREELRLGGWTSTDEVEEALKARFSEVDDGS